MTDRENLIELLETIPHPQRLYPDLFVDSLIANGVTVQGWIPVTEQKPEESNAVGFYVDEHISFTTVLVCGGQKGVTIANRLNVHLTGIPYLDEHSTMGWEWSKGHEDCTHWMPLPEPPKEGAPNG